MYSAFSKGLSALGRVFRSKYRKSPCNPGFLKDLVELNRAILRAHGVFPSKYRAPPRIPRFLKDLGENVRALHRRGNGRGEDHARSKAGPRSWGKALKNAPARGRFARVNLALRIEKRASRGRRAEE
jgi:hypothetical protein